MESTNLSLQAGIVRIDSKLMLESQHDSIYISLHSLDIVGQILWRRGKSKW
jgi:hypothetical protein